VRLSNPFKPTKLKRAVFFIIADALISLFTLFLAYLLRFNFSIPPEYLKNFFYIYLIIMEAKIFYYYIFNLYFVSWRFFSLYELKRFAVATLLAYVSVGVLLLIFRDFFIPYPRSVIIIDFFLSLIFLGAFRISKRLLIEKISTQDPPAVIIGANQKTVSLLKQNIPYSVTGIYDTGELVNTYLHGYKVKDFNTFGGEIKTALITKELTQRELNKTVDFLKSKGVEEIKLYSPFEEKLKSISIEDLLARKPKDLDKDAIKSFVKNKKILITGGGGSIGSEIARLCERYGARELILVDNCEYNLYKIDEGLNIQRKNHLIDISKYEEIKRVISQELPDIVIHAAAYKHVHLCEQNPRSAVINNILGTKNVIDLCVKYGVKNFILISTDKAVRPTNIMGATKRVCEIYAQNVPGDTKIAAVRFGNVLGSSGSVVPKFKKFIEEGRPLPVTHPNITRYFMLVSEACELVLQAGSLAKNREIFILDMGKPVKIADLAKKMLKLSGKSEENIIFTGLRDGEKLYEELLIDEVEKKTRYESIYVASASRYDIDKLNKQINSLIKLTKKEDIIKKLKEIVKEYNPKDEK